MCTRHLLVVTQSTWIWKRQETQFCDVCVCVCGCTHIEGLVYADICVCMYMLMWPLLPTQPMILAWMWSWSLFISATLRAILAGVLLLVGPSMMGRFDQTKWESQEVMGCNTVTVPIPQRNSTQCWKYQNFKDQLVPKGNYCYNKNTAKQKKNCYCFVAFSSSETLILQIIGRKTLGRQENPNKFKMTSTHGKNRKKRKQLMPYLVESLFEIHIPVFKYIFPIVILILQFRWGGPVWQKKTAPPLTLCPVESYIIPGWEKAVKNDEKSLLSSSWVISLLLKDNRKPTPHFMPSRILH